MSFDETVIWIAAKLPWTLAVRPVSRVKGIVRKLTVIDYNEYTPCPQL